MGQSWSEMMGISLERLKIDRVRLIKKRACIHLFHKIKGM